MTFPRSLRRTTKLPRPTRYEVDDLQEARAIFNLSIPKQTQAQTQTTQTTQTKQKQQSIASPLRMDFRSFYDLVVPSSVISAFGLDISKPLRVVEAKGVSGSKISIGQFRDVTVQLTFDDGIKRECLSPMYAVLPIKTDNNNDNTLEQNPNPNPNQHQSNNNNKDSNISTKSTKSSQELSIVGYHTLRKMGLKWRFNEGIISTVIEKNEKQPTNTNQQLTRIIKPTEE